MFEYQGPIATLKLGSARIVSGNIKLIHVVNISNYEEVLSDTISTVKAIDKSSILNPQLEYQISQIQGLIRKLIGTPSRKKRSINWIGSAWKWLAGSPDATDWDNIIKSQDEIISNNNEQYKINTKLMESTNAMIDQYNRIIKHLDERDNGKFEQMLFNRLSILKQEINEIVLAEQLAKKGIINTNLLDKEEIRQLITQIETLPYENEIEALEYAEPIIVTKGSIFLYIISLPKTTAEEYNHIIIRPVTRNKKQVYLDFKELIVNQVEKYGVNEKCTNIRNLTICKGNQLEKLPNDHCISHLVRGLKAECDYQINNKEKIETIDENTIFLDNFFGEIFEKNLTRHLNGSYVIQYYNETIKIRNVEFVNKETKSFQILPAVLQTNIIERNLKPNVEYLHELHLNNRRQLQNLSAKHGISLITNLSLVTVLIIIFSILIVFKFKGKKAKLELTHPAAFSMTSTPSIQDLHPVKINF